MCETPRTDGTIRIICCLADKKGSWTKEHRICLAEAHTPPRRTSTTSADGPYNSLAVVTPDVAAV